MAYSSTTDVKRFLPKAVTTEGLTPSVPNVLHPSPVSLTDLEIASFIALADSDINSRLSGVYDVPLKKVNMGGLVQYPPPIPLISARFAAMLIFQQRLSGAERQDAEWVKENFNRATDEMLDIESGRQRLAGQYSTRSSRFVKSDWFPIPPWPSKFPPDRGR